jgi:hypothetical protein
MLHKSSFPTSRFFTVPLKSSTCASQVSATSISWLPIIKFQTSDKEDDTSVNPLRPRQRGDGTLTKPRYLNLSPTRKSKALPYPTYLPSPPPLASPRLSPRLASPPRSP